MKNMNDAIDKVFDALIDEAAAAVNEKEGEKYSLADTDIEFSKEHVQKMKRLFRKERQKRAFGRASHYAKIAACVFVVIVGVMSAAIYGVEAWRIKFMQFVFDSDAPNTAITFEETKQREIYSDMVELEYIPQGFTLEESEASSKRVFMSFADGNKYFYFRISKYGLNTKIDTEEAAAESIGVSGKEGIYVSKQGVNILVWHDNIYTYRITSNIEKSEIVKIAENVRIK